MAHLSKDFDSLIRAHFASDPKVMSYETAYPKAGSVFSRDGQEEITEADMLRAQIALIADKAPASAPFCRSSRGSGGQGILQAAF